MTVGDRDNLLIETHAMVRELKATVEPLALQTEKNTRDIDEIKCKPGKRWESVVSAVIATGAGILAGIFTKKL
jgi:hypothetical protein